MGCDIHVHCEYRKDKNSQWINCDNFYLNPYVDAADKWENFVPDERYSIDKKMYRRDIYDGRSYEMFGVLAGVRSVSSHQIDEPRGLPDDVHWLTKKLFDEEENWIHSTSWLYAEELFDWKKDRKREWKKAKKGKKVRKDGWDEYVLLNGESEDDEFSDIFYNESHILDYLIRQVKHKMCEDLYIFDDDDYEKYGKNFRIVFWFDS